ncbi:MAG: glycoside hydrolase family 3 N-terminal domain-containing protein [Firmicutes bacterium]|nr:glycoside hydrolase family 3 N-terminal domain-containing protein [Bacillota bacterium]
MVDLKKRPFYLNDKQVRWVENTIASMSEDEKIGQLFINLTLRRDPASLEKIVNQYHVGGIRWQGGSAQEVWEQNHTLQQLSKVPLLIAANCEAGGNGLAGGGTMVATGAACGASKKLETTRDMARVGAQEAGSIGCNWTFAPVCDVLMNWRNTIVNTRAFGDNKDEVAARAVAYMDEMHRNGIACAAKHFPGDGTEERDQHLVMGCNDLSCDEWDNTFGKVYKTLIEHDLDSIMAGHICQPAYERRFSPSLTDAEIKPATTSKELLQGLLRGQLGFNGLIVTDATHMAGWNDAGAREDILPQAIAAGCDMILFFNDPLEDIEFVRRGLCKGIITQERLQDALLRILGLKAKLGLDHLVFPPREGISCIGCAEHHEKAAKAADESITLVKDTQQLLPVRPEEKKRVLLYYLQSAPKSLADGTDPAKKMVIEELEKAGFSVTAPEDYYEMEMKEQSVFHRFKVMNTPKISDFRQSYDWVLVVSNMQGYAQTNNVRITYSAGHSFEIPWYEHELPTVAVSLSYTNHLFDLPMMKTFINAYCPTREYIHALVEKITGKSGFKGRANDLVWCGRWDTQR